MNPFYSPFQSAIDRSEIRNLPRSFDRLASRLVDPVVLGRVPYTFLQAKGFKGQIPLPQQVAGVSTRLGSSGLVQMGNSVFSMPAWSYSGGRLQHIVDRSYEEMSKAAAAPGKYLKSIGGPQYRLQERAIKLASKRLLERSRSTIRSALGPDYTLAWHRSYMVNLEDMPIAMGGEYASAGGTVGSQLKAIRTKFSAYATSGGHELLQKQREAERHYAALIEKISGSSIAGQRLHIETVKDILFRKAGVASFLSASDIAFDISAKQMGKGIHQLAKLFPMQVAALRKYGFKQAVAVGARYGEELQFVNRLARLQGIKGGRTTRFAGNVFYALGEGPSVEVMKPLSILGDSYAIGGKGLFNIMTRDYSFGGVNTATKKLMVGGISSLDQLAIHPELAAYAKAIMMGKTPAGMVKTAMGGYRFESTKWISPVQRGATYAHSLSGRRVRTPLDMRFWLGTSYGPGGPGVSASERAAMAIGAPEGYRKLGIVGLRYTGEEGGTLEIEFERMNRMRGRGSTSVPMLMGSKRTKVSAKNQSLKTIGGQRIDIIARGMDFGLANLTEAGDAFVTPEFLQGRLMPHYMGLARQRGKLGAFTEAISGYQTSGPFASLKDIGSASPETTVANFRKLLAMRNEELRSIGIEPGELHNVLKTEGEGLAIRRSAITATNIAGKRVMGLMLDYQTLARRAGQLEYGKIGRGAMRYRLSDLVPAIEQQMAGIKSGTELYSAYESFRGSMLNDIRIGAKMRFGRTATRGMPTAAQEIASILLAQLGRQEATGGLFAGMKSHAQEMDIHQWFARAEAGELRPLSTTRAGLKGMVGRGLLERDVAGTVHAFGPSGFTGLNLVLPQEVETQLMPGMGGVIKSNRLYIPTDKLLGASPRRGELFVAGKGLRDLGLPRTKATFMTLLYEKMAAYKAERGSTHGFTLDKELLELASTMSTHTRWAMPGKKGLLYHQLAGEPGGAFRMSASPLEGASAEDAFKVGVNEYDMRKILRKAGYSAQEAKDIVAKQLAGESADVFGTMVRYPVYRGQNVGAMKFMAMAGVERGSMHVHAGAMANMFGDFDWDTVAGWIDKSQQKSLQHIHQHRTALLSAFNRSVTEKERMEIKQLRSTILSDLWKVSGEKYKDKAAFLEAINKGVLGRYRGAAGGGALVGPVFMGYSRLTMMANATMREEGQSWIKVLSEQNKQLADELIGLRSSMQGSRLLQYFGTLKEAGIYGTLKKGSQGFGTADYSTLESLIDYSRDATEANAARVRTSLRAGFLEGLRGDTVKVGELFDELGISQQTNLTNEEIADILTKRLTTGEGHEGILTIAKTQQALRSVGLTEPIEELFRGRDPTKAQPVLARRLRGLFERMVGEGPETQVASAGYAADAAAKVEKRMELVADRLAKREEAAAFGKNIFEKGMERLTSLAKSPWGKRAMIGAGIVAGIGAIDSVFSMFRGGEDAEPPLYSQGGQAPLPPPVNLSLPDQTVEFPSNSAMISRRPQIARLERPMGSRQMYNISARSTQDSDLSFIGSNYMGNAGTIPSRSSHIVDHSSRYDEQEMSYQIRARLNSSF